ncbi:DUF3014 domain-containing protein [Haliea sp. E17]|uniref:DUF3014 domain-containing protein n=1 Tax=Haliea sp. E17 TaxID=3401576 RepID=UPI003AADBA22
MQADAEDRYTDEPRRSGGFPKLPIVLGVAAAMFAIGWYISGTNEEPIAEVPPALVINPAEPPAPVVEPTPDIPVEAVEVAPEVTEAAEPNAPPPPPPLTLATSDPAVRASLASDLDSPLFQPSLNQENLIERATAVIDATSSGSLLRKVLALPPVEGKFSVEEGMERVVLDPQSYHRYDAYAQAVDALNAEHLGSAFHTFRGLLEEAYSALGYPADDLDNTLIRALDQIIAAPVLDIPPELVKDVTTYKYVDPSLEQQTPLAKQLMRMGPDNQRIIQAKARELRAELLGN